MRVTSVPSRDVFKVYVVSLFCYTSNHITLIHVLWLERTDGLSLPSFSKRTWNICHAKHIYITRALVVTLDMLWHLINCRIIIIIIITNCTNAVQGDCDCCLWQCCDRSDALLYIWFAPHRVCFWGSGRPSNLMVSVAATSHPSLVTHSTHTHMSLLSFKTSQDSLRHDLLCCKDTEFYLVFMLLV